MNHWLPGSIELFTDEFFRQVADLPPGDVASVADSLPVPSDLPTGDYTLSIAVVADATAKPVVQLGIRGRGPDGWYALSAVKVIR